MRTGTVRGILLAGLALGLLGCQEARAPTGPSTVQPPTPSIVNFTQVANVILSGMVYELTPAGRMLIAGVRVVSDHDHQVWTDAQGFFSFGPVRVCPCVYFPLVAAGATSILVEKDGYQDPTPQPASLFFPGRATTAGVRDLIIQGDTRFDVELVRR